MEANMNFNDEDGNNMVKLIMLLTAITIGTIIVSITYLIIN